MIVDIQLISSKERGNVQEGLDNGGFCAKFVVTIPATLPVRSAHPGGFFYFKEVAYAVF
jgi:hypothetical protein